VHDHEVAVLAQVQVQLYAIHTFPVRADERAESVLRLDAHQPPVSDGQK
jgi:hypothetical protein